MPTRSLTTIICSLCKGSGYQYREYIKNIYPKEPNGEIVQQNVGKLTMYAVTNPDQLPTIGKFLEAQIKRHVAKRKIGYAIVGCRAFDELIQACHSEMQLFIIHIVNVVKILLADSDARLRIKATETLQKTIHFMGQTLIYRNLVTFIEPLIDLIGFKSANQQDQEKTRVAAIRCISKMAPVMQNYIFDKFDILTPALLDNIWDPELKYLTSGQTTDPHKSLSHKDVMVEPGQLPRTALLCLGTLSSETTPTTIRAFMQPILNYFGKNKCWDKKEFIELIMCAIISKNGFDIAIELLHHLKSVTDTHIKIRIVETISYIVCNQSITGSVGPRALQALTALLQQLVLSRQSENEENIKENLDFQDSVLQTIEAIAKRGEHSSQNIEMMTTTLSVLKKCKHEEDILLLLRTILLIAKHPAMVPMGRAGYPDSFVNTLLALPESGIKISQSPRSRDLILQIFREFIIKRKQDGTRGRKMTISGSITSPNAPSNKTFATLSEKQISEFYSYLFKIALMQDCTPNNFVELFLTFMTLLNENRYKDLEHSVPIMFRLQELSATMTNKMQACAIQTLVIAYFLVLANIYNTRELEQYIQEVVERRLKVKQMSPEFTKFFETYKIDEMVKDTTPLKEIFSFNVSNEENLSENILNKDKVINILCKIETLKQTNKNVKETLSAIYTGFVSQLTMAVVSKSIGDKDDLKWDLYVGEESLSERTTIHDKKEEMYEEKFDGDITKADFAKLGEHAWNQSFRVNSAFKESINAIPKNGDQPNVSGTNIDINIIKEKEIGPDSIIKLDMPPLYLFDTHEYITAEL